jgi:hypothetical protein
MGVCGALFFPPLLRGGGKQRQGQSRRRACLPALDWVTENGTCPAPLPTLQIVLSTNIAETSVTIPGIRFVIDSGFVKSRSYSARLGADCLQVRRRGGRGAALKALASSGVWGWGLGRSACMLHARD